MGVVTAGRPGTIPGMKPLWIALALACALSVVTAAFVISKPARSQFDDPRAQSRIAEAVHEYGQAQANFQREWDSPKTRQASPKSYLLAIKRIKLSKCPRDFRIAALEYNQAVERQDVAAIRELIEVAGLAKLDTRGMENQFSREDSFRESRFNLEKICLRYGIDFRRTN